MVGAIVKRDIVAHPVVTIRCFGWRVFWKAMVAGPNTTFLSLLTHSEVLEPAGDRVPEFVERCVELELKASRVYDCLSRRFADQPAVCKFFTSLAAQEHAHAELLELAEKAAALQRWDEAKAAPWRSVVPRLEQHMEQVIASLEDVQTVSEALQRVIHIESSEINDVFQGVISAADTPFVRQVAAFQTAESSHLRFICDSIARLEPDLVPASQVLARRIAA